MALGESMGRQQLRAALLLLLVSITRSFAERIGKATYRQPGVEHYDPLETGVVAQQDSAAGVGVLPSQGMGAVRSLLQDEAPLTHFDSLVSKYYSQEELEAYLKDYAGSRCKRISRLYSIGKSVEGRDLWVLEISDKAGEREVEPNFKYVGNVHGDEPTGRQLTLVLAEWLCQHYPSDKRAHDLVHRLHLHLMPSMNPDGFVAKRRENMNKRDLNRDFPDPIRGSFSSKEGGFLAATGKEQPETKAVMDWLLATRFSGSATMHEGAVVANYPWDGTKDGSTSYNASGDDAAFRHLASYYATRHKTMHQSKEFKGGVTNGAAWYPVYGGMQDWNYLRGGCMELTLELSQNKAPPAAKLRGLWEENFEALVGYPLVATLGGVRGVVRDHPSGEALAATIGVSGVPFNYSSASDHGDYYRPLAPGTYAVTAVAPGHHPHTEEVEVPQDGSGVTINFHLEPTGSGSGGGADGRVPQRRETRTQATTPRGGARHTRHLRKAGGWAGMQGVGAAFAAGGGGSAVTTTAGGGGARRGFVGSWTAYMTAQVLVLGVIGSQVYVVVSRRIKKRRRGSAAAGSSQGSAPLPSPAPSSLTQA